MVWGFFVTVQDLNSYDFSTVLAFKAVNVQWTLVRAGTGKYRRETKDMRKKRIISTCLVLFWMVLIFSFSAKNAEVSTQMSTSVGEMVCKIFVPGYTEWTEEEQYELAAKIDYTIRKPAHAAEYAVLGGLLLCMFTSWLLGERKSSGFHAFLPAFATGVLYAAGDEVHQLFVPGRSGQVSDVLLDSAGVFAGVGIIFIIQRIWNHKKNRSLREQLKETT